MCTIEKRSARKRASQRVRLRLKTMEQTNHKGVGLHTLETTTKWDQPCSHVVAQAPGIDRSLHSPTSTTGSSENISHNTSHFDR